MIWYRLKKMSVWVLVYVAATGLSLKYHVHTFFIGSLVGMLLVVIDQAIDEAHDHHEGN